MENQPNPLATSTAPPALGSGDFTAALARRLPHLMGADDADLDASNADRLASQERQQLARRESAWQAVVKAIGSRYADCRLCDYQVYGKGQREAVNLAVEYANEMSANVKAGRCVVLYGRPGTGKDFLVASLLRMAVLDNGLSARWINGQDFYGRVRDAMDDGGERESKIITELTAPEVLAISDPVPPKDAVSAFQQSILYRAIDGRYRNCKATWVTMNVANGAEARQRMGDAVVDRLTQEGLTVFCDWESFRTRKVK